MSKKALDAMIMFALLHAWVLGCPSARPSSHFRGWTRLYGSVSERLRLSHTNIGAPHRNRPR